MLRVPEQSVAAYAGIRTRVRELLADVTDQRAAITRVPACPMWSITGVVAHLYGVERDILDGNLEGVGTAAWADDQVARFSHLGLHALLDEWDAISPEIETLAPHFPPEVAAQFVFDATTHEHDLRGALLRPGGRGSDAVTVSLTFIGNQLSHRAGKGTIPTVELTTPLFSAQCGPEPIGLRLDADAFEVFRSFGGRRTLDEVRALPWDGDPEGVLPYFAATPFTPPEESLGE